MRPSRGIALVATLLLSLGLMLLAATTFAIAHLDGWIAVNQVAGERALYAAEAGVEHALALVPPAPDFSAEAAWAGAGLPFGPVVEFPHAPLSYRVRVSAAAGDRLEILSTGTAFRGAERRIEATLCRDPQALSPAALVLGAGAIVGAIAGEVSIEGEDAGGLVPARLRVAGESAEVALAATGVDAEPSVLPLGSGFAPTIPTLRAVADRTIAGPLASATLGTPAAPEVVRLVTSGELDGSSTANGILLAEAPLRVRGRLELEGLLLAAAGLEIEGELVVRGAAFVSERLELPPASGRLEVVFSSAALAGADALRPGILPRGAILCGWRELW